MRLNRGNINNNKGQVLLITVLLLATVITLVMTVVIRSRTDTQVTKLEEDSQKALKASEAGIEVGLRQQLDSTQGNKQTFSYSNVPVLNDLHDVDVAHSQFTVELTPVTQFVTPLLDKDQQYTFYLSNYNQSSGQFTNSWSGNIDLYINSQSYTSCTTGSVKPAIEATIVYGDVNAYKVSRWVIDPCSSPSRISGTLQSSTTTSISIDGTSFSDKTQITAPANSKLLIVRTYFSDSKIGIKSLGAPFSAQGKMIMATSVLNTNAQATEKYFQSYPQIPAEFFITSL